MQIKEYILHYTWDIAYGEYNKKIVERGLEGITLHVVSNPYKKKWFADPFILKEDEKELHLLVEEFDSDIKRGRIAHLIIDKNRDVIVDCQIILDLPTHLSFPAIYRLDGGIFVHPENSRSGKSFIYEYDQVNDLLFNPVCICEEPISDAIIEKKGDYYEMYATRDPKPNGNILIKYRADSLWGPYKETSQIEFDSNVARMAGAFIHSSVGEIRPAQDCNGAYGRAVLFFKGDELLSELRPNGIKFSGIHTFNMQNDTFVIDLKKYDFPLLYYLKTKIKR